MREIQLQLAQTKKGGGVKEQTSVPQAWLQPAQIMSSGPGLTPSIHNFHLPPLPNTMLPYVMPLPSFCNPIEEKKKGVREALSEEGNVFVEQNALLGFCGYG